LFFSAQKCIFAAIILVNRLKMMYNWQHKDWANFTYNRHAISEQIPDFLRKANEMSAFLQGLTAAEQQEELVKFMISEAVKTSEIEGEYISRQDLMSSIKNKLGIISTPRKVKDKRAAAVANLMIAVRNSYHEKLTETEIKQWHKLLFENSKTIKAGKWRTGTASMQVVSGAMGKETVHYEAPPSYRVSAEMKQFVRWYYAFEIIEPYDILIKTAVSHLYFESIHPFEDGNGRIGRAIAEKCLAQSLGKLVLLSLSSVIEKERKNYYDALKNAQNTLEITDWVIYFANVITQAQTEAVETVKLSLQHTHFFDLFKNQFNDRQLKVIKKMVDAGAGGFKGGMTAKKYISITRTSKATATRDLQQLVQIGALIMKGDGRNVHYLLNTT
jgi:Fic family protein